MSGRSCCQRRPLLKNIFMRLPSLNCLALLLNSFLEILCRWVALSFPPCDAPPNERKAWTIRPVFVSSNPRRALSFPPADLRLAERPFELRVFDTRRAGEMRHAQRSALVRGEKRRVERDVPDMPACHVQPREPVDRDRLHRQLRREHAAPDLGAMRGIGKWKLHDESDAAKESGIEQRFRIGGEDGETAITLHALQEIGELDVGVAVVTVLHLAAFAEQRIGLVEQQHRAAGLGGTEQAFEVFLGLADVFAHHRGEVDAIKIAPEVGGDDLGREGLARAALAREQRTNAEAARPLRGVAPLLVDRRAMMHLVRDVAQDRELARRQHEFVAGRRYLERRSTQLALAGEQGLEPVALYRRLRQFVRAQDQRAQPAGLAY